MNPEIGLITVNNELHRLTKKNRFVVKSSNLPVYSSSVGQITALLLTPKLHLHIMTKNKIESEMQAHDHIRLMKLLNCLQGNNK